MLVPPDQAAALDQAEAGMQSVGEHGGSPADTSNAQSPASGASQPAKDETPAMSRVDMARALKFSLPEDATDEQVDAAFTELQQYASLGRQFRQNPQQFSDWIKGGQASGEPTQPASQPAKAPEGGDPFAWPELDPQLANLCIIDPETGLARARHDGVPSHIVAQVNKYLYEREQLNEQFSKNPVKFTYERIKEPLIAQLREEIRQELASDRQRAEQEAFHDEISKKYYASDDKGNLLMDPKTGEFATSDWGRAYMTAIHTAVQMGATNELQMQKWAAQQADMLAKPAEKKAEAPTAPVKTAEQVRNEKNEAFLAGMNPSSSGYAASNPSVNEPINGMSSGDLDNFFVTKARAAGIYQDVFE